MIAHAASPSDSLPKKSRLRRWLRRLGLLLLALLLLLLALVIYHRTIGASRLADAIASADRLDPGWDWESLQDRRAPVPDGQNAAPVVLEAAKLIPENWPPQPDSRSPFADEKSIPDRIRDLDPPEQLDADLLKAARAELEKFGPALRVAHRLRDFRTGRFPDLSFEDYHFSSKRSHLQQCSQVAKLLWIDVALRAQDEKPQAALDSTRCLMIAGRSISDEPGPIAHLVRNACRHLAVRSVERTLAQTQAAEKDLVATQQLLEDEQAQNTLLMALRGERAFEHRVMSWVDANDREHLDPMLGGNEVVTASRDHPWVMAFCHWFMVGWLKENHAVMLELSNETVEIAKLPVDDQVDRFKELDTKTRLIRARGWPPYRYAFGCLTIPAMVKVAESFARTRAELRCAVAALAAERFRLTHGRWPKNLDELTPRFLTEVPLDPFDRKPLKLRGFDDGILIYSIGPDRADDGGKVDRKLGPWERQDLGCRLWNVAQRRQPPRPRADDGEEK